MFEPGVLCVKLKGRDSGKYAVVVENIDDIYVLIDGNVRRRKCNKSHLEIIGKKLDVKKGASSLEIQKVLEKEGLFEQKKVVKKSKKPKKTEATKTDSKK